MVEKRVRVNYHLGGLLVPISTKKRIKSATKSNPPAMLPTLAITSARSFSLSCNGVFSESRRKAMKSVLSESQKGGLRDEPIMIRPLKLFCPTEMIRYEPTPSTTLLPLTRKQSV